jgi:hypothetical protein
VAKRADNVVVTTDIISCVIDAKDSRAADFVANDGNGVECRSGNADLITIKVTICEAIEEMGLEVTNKILSGR